MKLKRLKEDNKGVMAIEIVIGCFIFLMVMCLLMDLLVLSWKFAVISQLNTKIARQAGVQGGYLSSAPTAYPGGDSAYTSISELNAMVTDHLKKAGIAEDEWSLKIDNRKVLGGGTLAPTAKIEYRETLETELTITYEWETLSNFLPGNLTNTLTSKRPSMSEWKYDYNIWDGE